VDGLILSSSSSGCLIPALAARPVYVGHWSETPHAEQRAEESHRFYGDRGLRPEARRVFLAARGIRYIYCGTIERALGGDHVAQDPFLRPVYRNAGVTIYAFQPTREVELTFRPAPR
jgi:uncharacterized membrane protein